MVRLIIEDVQKPTEKVNEKVDSVIAFCTTKTKNDKGFDSVKSEAILHAELTVDESIAMIQRMTNMSATLYKDLEEKLDKHDMLIVQSMLGIVAMPDFTQGIKEVKHEC